ncbi:Nramp family divalent metal transporter [Cellulosimicrobium funkei]|nr:Nramp family divalent metal transporter [Cellulosimicrobium funkei]
MTTKTTEASVTSQGEPVDLYHLDPDAVREPPTKLSGKVKFLGPGMLTSAAVIGSGELITTTALGAQAGFALLWLIIISTLVKVWVHIEFAQWTILTGKTAIDGYSTIGPRWRGIGIINMLWIANEFPKLIQRGGVVGGTAAALSLAFPVFGAPLSGPSMSLWVVVVVITVVALLYTNRYGLIEKIATVAILFLVGVTLVLALGLPLTPFAYDAGDIAYGLSFNIPAGALGIALAMFGLTGFTAPEINTYGYWCIEKGYARWVGSDDGSEDRARRAKGWISVMRLDVACAWVVMTVCTMGFYVMGAAVLHPQGLVPQGNEVIATLSRMYTDTMGEWAGPLFLLAAVLTLGSTTLSVGAAMPRLWTNTLGLLGLAGWNDPVRRRTWIRIWSVALPILWAVSYFAIQEPVLMIMIGGIADALFLIAMVFAIWILRTREVERRFRRSSFWTIALLVSSGAILSIGAMGLLEILGVPLG